MSTEPTTPRPSAPAAPEGVETADAVVVGAGVAGLTAARTLRAQGLRVVVLDAAEVPGGPVRGGDLPGLDGVRVDLGAESFAARGTAVGDLVRELGLDVVEPSGAGAWGYAAGHAYPLPRAGVLGIPADPWSRDVRRAVGLGGSLRASLDRVLPRRFTDLRTLETFARSRMGARVTERLVAPVASGVHSAPLDRLDVAAVAPGLREAFEREGSLARAVASMRALAPAGSAVRGIDGGMHRLVEGLVAGTDVRLRHEVTGISRVAAPDGGPGAWLVRAETPSGPVDLAAPRLVVTTPALVDALGPLVGTAADLLPDPEPGADVRLVTLLLRAPELDGRPARDRAARRPAAPRRRARGAAVGRRGQGAHALDRQVALAARPRPRRRRAGAPRGAPELRAHRRDDGAGPRPGRRGRVAPLRRRPARARPGPRRHAVERCAAPAHARVPARGRGVRRARGRRARAGRDRWLDRRDGARVDRRPRAGMCPRPRARGVRESSPDCAPE